jgi:ABC-type glycerol-3-phosphate transport system permease component
MAYEAIHKLGLVLIVIFVVFPILWIALTAFKNPVDSQTTRILFTPTLENFKVINGPLINVKARFINSLVISLATLAIAIPLALMAAYVFSRHAFKGSRPLLVYILTTQFVPPVVIVLPFFAIFLRLRLLDTKLSLVTVNLSIALPYAIWLLKGFVDSLPTEIEEAAVIDGCSQFQTLRYVIFPLAAPGIITTSIFVFINSWNEFLYALIFTRSEQSKTITIALMSTIGPYGVLWERMSAVGILVILPVLVLSFFIRKHFVQGLTMGGVK